MNDLYKCDYCDKGLDHIENVYVSVDLSVFCSRKCALKHEYKDISKMSINRYADWVNEIGNCNFCDKSLQYNDSVYVTKDLSSFCSKKCANSYVNNTIGKMSMHKYMSDCAQFNGYSV